jgi:hypothetical protein
MVTKAPLLALVLVVPFFLSSCGGGGTASSDTVINGISVPPEPDPTANNATLAGIDSNSNGVRDDVERKIAEKSDTNTFSGNLALAKALSDFQQIDFNNRASLMEYKSGIHCAVFLSGMDSSEIKQDIANNQDRKDFFRTITVTISGYGSDEIQPCQ